MTVYLSKDEELALGTLIQKANKVKEISSVNEHQESIELNGEVIAASEIPKIIKAGDKALVELLKSNEALVWSRARIFKNRHPISPDLDDLAQDGYMGLLTAASKYDPTRGNKFSTVAYYWIDQAIARSVNKTGRLIRLPENRVQEFFNITKVKSLYDDGELSPRELDEIAMEELNISKDDFQNIMTAAAHPTSFSKKIGSGDSDNRELIDWIADEHAEESSETIAIREGMQKTLESKLDELDSLEKEIVVASYLIEDTADKRNTIKAIRDEHKLTPQKYKRILNNALLKLRGKFDGLDLSFADFLD